MATEAADVLTGGLASDNAASLLTGGLAGSDGEENPGGGTGATAQEIAAAVWATEIEPGVTALQAFRVALAVLCGQATVTGSTSTFLRRDGETPAVAVTADISGNRSVSTIGDV